MNKHYLEMPLEDLCATALLELDAASEALCSADIAGSAHDRAILARWSARMAGDLALKPGVSSAMARVIGIVEAQLDAETLEQHAVVDGHPDTEEGPVGQVIRVRILTERGRRLEAWHGRLRRLRHMLQVAEARLGAERAINARMS